jgi:hypothetical protein
VRFLHRFAQDLTADIEALVADLPADHVSGPARDFAAATLEVNRERILSDR